MQSSSQVMFVCVCVCVLALVLTLFTSLCGEALLGLFLLQQRVCLGYLESEGCLGKAVASRHHPCGLLKSLCVIATVPWSCAWKLMELVCEFQSIFPWQQRIT